MKALDTLAIAFCLLGLCRAAAAQDAAPAQQPDIVTISFGLNDTGLLMSEEHEEFLVKTVDAIQAGSKAKVMLVTSTPFVNASHFWGRRFTDKGGLDEYMDANICARMRAPAAARRGRQRGWRGGGRGGAARRGTACIVASA